MVVIRSGQPLVCQLLLILVWYIINGALVVVINYFFVSFGLRIPVEDNILSESLCMMAAWKRLHE